MPFTVDQLISEHQKLITVPRDTSVKTALELMIEHDFNQLPVVDTNMKLLGMVTGASILRAMKNFGTTVDGLHVSHALVSVDKHFLDDDLFELLDDLRDGYAVVIVDGDDKAVGIVTSYDTTEYFRRRAQDMMYVEDIESALKEYISSAFMNEQGVVDETARAAAVQEATQSDAENRKQFNKAVGHYLNAVKTAANQFDPNQAKAVFDADYPRPAPKGFEDLSLGEVNQMLLHDSTWVKVCDIFNLDKKAVLRLLDEVRKTRNSLFHFRGEISPNQRAQLQFCADWLNRQRPTPAVLQSSGSVVSGTAELMGTSTLEVSATVVQPVPDELRLVPIEDIGSPDSRYAALARHLQSLPDSEDNTSMTFEQVETVIGDRLPANARQHRSWWANDSVSHVQSQQWLDAGWRVNGINITGQRVNFARNRERERLYIDFFSAAIADLEAEEEFPIRATSPGGHSWQTVAVLPRSGPQQAIFTLAFTFRSRFRVELYIDTWDGERNKKVFDQLYAGKSEIEVAVGASLSWERLDSKRACRVALYHDGSIIGAAAELGNLRSWAQDAMSRLYHGLAERAETALMETLT